MSAVHLAAIIDHHHTTEPNELVRPIHNRMPVILRTKNNGLMLPERLSPKPNHS
jgi:putative SOS response-associated peptidase YedK